MFACGWQLEENGATLVLRDAAGRGVAWDRVPEKLLQSLVSAKREVEAHMYGLEHPDVPDVAAIIAAVVRVGGAERESATDEHPDHAGLARVELDAWVTCLETILTYVRNVLQHMTVPKFRTISTANPAFEKRVGRIAGGIEMLVALGWREGEGGGRLQ